MKTINKAAAKAQQGFTLVELLIVVAIIGILAAVATPMYQDYIAEANEAAVLSAADAYKTPVAICAQVKGTYTGCSNGVESIPAAIAATDNNKAVKTLLVTDGKISIEGTTEFGGKSYCLTPSTTGGVVTWTQADNACS